MSSSLEVIDRMVIPSTEIRKVVSKLAKSCRPDAIVIGNGTSAGDVSKAVSDLDIAPVIFIEEKFTSLEARARYWRENPPRGLRKLIPVSLQTPGCPYDDYVAVILAEKFFAAS